ncbi:MAG: DeoR/GlpR family DNA-binding transcription regulator [Verrucomicrobiota bacterium]
MRTTLRHREILELLDVMGELSVPEVCSRLSLSPATARRAFAKLAAAGLAKKVWGGLMRRNPATLPGNDMVPSSLRENLNAEAKDAIARQAAMLVEDGDVVAIDGGTTTLRLSSYLANRPIRILTNSILIAHRIEQLRHGPKSAEVFLTGGFVYPRSGLLVGPQAVANLRDYHSRWAFLSVGGLDPQGATNTNQLVVESERAMIEQTENAVILADHSKWDHRDMIRQCTWSEIFCLITDRKPDGWMPPIAPENIVIAPLASY